MTRHILFAAILLAGSHPAIAQEPTASSANSEPRALKLRLDDMGLAAVAATPPETGAGEPMVAQMGQPQVITPIPMDPAPASGPPKKPYLQRITGWQWVGIGAAVVAAGVIVAEGGGGGGGNGDPIIDQTGGN